MNKLAMDRAFSEAYECAMEKIAASCCGGRGGQTMLVMHGAGKPKKGKKRKARK